MLIPASFIDLISALRSRTPFLVLVKKRGEPQLVSVQSIEAEDGSRRKWNVKVSFCGSGEVATLFWAEEGEPIFYLET
jgi:hypothetical protein